MEQFDLSLWLKDKSRKVVTRGGRPVRIICSDRKGKAGNIVGLVGEDESLIYVWNNDGKHIVSEIPDNDLFFADEELTEFDYAVLSIISDHNSHKDSIEAFAKRSSKKLLDLARKELQPEFDKEMEKMLAETDKVVYQKGRQDALKDLPKWKKLINGAQGSLNDIYLVRTSYGHYFVCSAITAGCEYLDLTELENLPKEE